MSAEDTAYTDGRDVDDLETWESGEPLEPSGEPPADRPMAGRTVLIAVLVAVATLGAAWWVLAGPGRSGQQQPTSAGRVGVQPVTEYAADTRGTPVELAGTSLTGGRIDLADVRGKVVVVNVWGSWCVPCRAEAPVLAKVSKEYADDVEFVGVDIKDSPASALAFEESYGVKYPSISDPSGQVVLNLGRHMPASVVPVTFVLDTRGRVAARVLGAVEESTLTALLDTALAEAT